MSARSLETAVGRGLPSRHRRARSGRRGARARVRRRGIGSALSEFGPALFILIIVGVFPVLDLILMGYGYCSVLNLNSLQIREACKTSSQMAQDPDGPVCKTIPNQWLSTTMGGIAGLTNFPNTAVNYDTDTGVPYVSVTTTVTMRPFLAIPFFGPVPGLGAPFTCTVSSSRVMEDASLL